MATTIIILVGADPTLKPPPEYDKRQRRKGYAHCSVQIQARREDAISAFIGYVSRIDDRQPQIIDTFTSNGWIFASITFQMKASEGNAESDVIPELNRAAARHDHVVSWDFASLVIGWEPRE